MADPATQKFVLKAILVLPTPILPLLSGGGVVLQGGRTLDPRLQFLANAGRSASLLSNLAPEATCAATAQGLASTSGRRESDVSAEPLSIDGPAGPIPLRAYRPPQLDPEASLIAFARFGGGVIGNLDTCDTFCSILAKLAIARWSRWTTVLRPSTASRRVWRTCWAPTAGRATTSRASAPRPARSPWAEAPWAVTSPPSWSRR